MSNPKHVHLILPGDLVAAVDARRSAATEVEGERVSMVKVLRRLIRAGLAAEDASLRSA